MCEDRDFVVGVLCGGSSRRMGEDKAGLRIKGRTMLEHVCAAGAKVSDRVVLLGRPSEVPESLRTLPVLEDRQSGLGPIGGLVTALSAYPDQAVLLLACDLPRLETTLLLRLRNESRPPGLEAVCFESPEQRGRLEPCCGLYLPEIRSRIERIIAQGRLSLHALLAEANVRRLAVPASLVDCLKNVNTPEDYRSI